MLAKYQAPDISFAFEAAFGCQGDRPMSVDMLPDEANTCSQHFKGEGDSSIDEKIVRLHQLAWQPARFAHPSWLMKMGLRSEKYHYGDCQTLDNILNRQLIGWRGFPKQPLPAVLTNKQKAQMALEPRLDAVCMALGLVSLRCSDYLRIRHYRQTLYPILNDEDVCQLLGIGCPGERAAILSPEMLPSIALQLGRGILHATSSAAVTWQALSILLPPLPRAIWLPSADLWLARLERLL